MHDENSLRGQIRWTSFEIMILYTNSIYAELHSRAVCLQTLICKQYMSSYTNNDKDGIRVTCAYNEGRCRRRGLIGVCWAGEGEGADGVEQVGLRGGPCQMIILNPSTQHSYVWQDACWQDLCATAHSHRGYVASGGRPYWQSHQGKR